MTLDIAVRDLRVGYGSFTAIHDLSFSLEGGKIYGLLGRNGSGKTTLLSALASFLKPVGGAIRIGGQDPFENRDVMQQVCMIRDTIDAMGTVREALAFAARCWPNWDAAYAETLIRRFNLAPNKGVDRLSRGMQSALGITLGLASRAPVTIFDEPHLGLDPHSRMLFFDELLHDFMTHPRTILLSTHLIDEVASLLEEVIIIEAGRLILQEETEQLLTRGATITGPAQAVDRCTQDLAILSERRVGGLKAVTVMGALSGERRWQAEAEGLDSPFAES